MNSDVLENPSLDALLPHREQVAQRIRGFWLDYLCWEATI